jgi:hypothetical protein
MAAVIQQQFDGDSIRRIAASVRRLEGQYVNLRRQLAGSDHAGAAANAIRTGITTVNAAHPVYPATGNQFVVQFEDLAFTESPGASTLETAAWPSKFVVARTIDGAYVAEGTRVTILRTPGKRGRRWWIIPTGSQASLSWARAQENWRKNGSDPRVSCKLVTGSPGRTSSTVSGSAFWLYLPRTGGRDPNVVANQNIHYMLDSDGAAACTGDYLDDKIGTVKMWARTEAAIPPGWALMNGIANAIGLGGTGISFLVGDGGVEAFPRFTGSDGLVGTSGGASTAIVPAHSAADVIACIGAHAADSTSNASWTVSPTFSAGEGIHGHAGSVADAGGSHGHTAGIDPDDGAHGHTATVSGSDGTHSHGDVSESGGSTGGSSGTTGAGYAVVSDAGHIHEINYVAIYPTEEGATERDILAATWTATGYADVSDAGHDHPIGTHVHIIGTHVHTVAASSGAHGHTITVTASEGTHNHEIVVSGGGVHGHTVTVASDGEHVHTFFSLGTHTHTTPALQHSGTQGSLTHESIATIPPYLNLMFIERIDNSAGE